MSTAVSETTGIFLSVKGREMFFPIKSLYLSSAGFTATAVSPSMVSGLVVATVRCPLPSENGYLI